MLPIGETSHYGFVAALESPDEARASVALATRLGYDSIWASDHIEYPLPMLDPLIQLAHASAHSRDLMFGTAVYLLPLRHPTPVAKEVATIDHVTGGRFIFGVGIGGEFPNEYEACQVPMRERGARLTESIDVLRALWSGDRVEYSGRHYSFPEIQMTPPPTRPGGPPIWCGGRSNAALDRIGRQADGWLSYLVTPDMYAKGLERIEQAALSANRKIEQFGSAHLIFLRIDDNPQRAFDDANAYLSKRYAMDFGRATEHYCAVGNPRQIAEQINEFHAAGVRHLILDVAGPREIWDGQLERFMREVHPLLKQDQSEVAAETETVVEILEAATLPSA